MQGGLYRKHWAAFAVWCAQQGFSALSAAPQTLALYLAARADEGRKVTTIALSLAAISQAHQVAGHPSPRSDRLVKETWKGIRRRPVSHRSRRTFRIRADIHQP
jgi:hypothetical protein